MDLYGKIYSILIFVMLCVESAVQPGNVHRLRNKMIVIIRIDSPATVVRHGSDNHPLATCDESGPND